jgi:hypothetical protein
MIRKLIVPLCAAALLVGSAACSRSREASPPPKTGATYQTPAKPADNMNAGVGYNGGDPENINRGSAPTGTGGGPGNESGAMDTSGMDQSETDMTGDKPKSKGTEKGSGTTGGVK